MSPDNPRIDDIDRGLLTCLRQNARMPLTAIAKTVGLSRGSAQDRLRRLERQGVILGYTVRLRAPSDAPLQAWFAVNLTPGLTCAHVAAALLARPEVTNCYSLAGPIDLLVLVQAPNAEALGAHRESIAGISGINSVQTLTVLAEHLAA